MALVIRRQAPGGGQLRHQLMFSERNQTQDEYGNVSTGWIDRFRVAADITPRLGGETVEAARLAGRQPVVIRVRSSPSTRQIQPDWKATANNGTEYNIRTAVDPFMGDGNRGMWIDMLAESGVAV